MEPTQRLVDKIHDRLGGFNNLLLIPMFTVMVLETSVGNGRDAMVGFDQMNLWFSGFFMAEWVLGLAISDDRRGYLLSWEKGLDFIASVPFGYIFQAMRVTRLVRILRVIRILLRARRFRGKGSKLLRVLGVVGATVFAGGLGLRIVEPQTVPTLTDSLWWSLITVSTVGYGDITPTSDPGRAVAAVLVFVGIGVFGYVAGFMTSLMEDPEEDEILATLKRIESAMEIDLRDSPDPPAQVGQPKG